MVPYTLSKAEQPDTSPHPAMADHPLFTGASTVGLMSGENPGEGNPKQATGHDSLKRDLDAMGLKYEETNGHYGIPERSVIIHGPSREQMTALGSRYGQDAVIYSEGPHRRDFIYTAGKQVGAHHPQTGTHEFWTPDQGAPDDYWTEIPGRGFIRMGFNFGQLHRPDIINKSVTREHLRLALLGALKKVLDE